MVYGDGNVVSGDDDSDSNTGSSINSSNCWSERANPVLDSVEDGERVKEE